MAVDDSESTDSLADVGSTETSSRDDVAAAFDAVEAREQAVESPQKDSAAPAPDAPAHEGRDAAGRFTPKRDQPAGEPESAPRESPPAGAKTAPGEAPGATAAPSAAGQVPPRLAKPPASWSQTEAAHWEKVPVEVREAVARREHDHQRVMQEAATARNGLTTLQQAVAPYIPNIQAANGGDVVGAIKTFFDYDNRLRHGSQIEKARAAVALIKGYGIDIGTLDNELAGAQHSPEQTQQEAIRAAIAREVGPLRQHLEQQAHYQQQQKEAAVAQNLATFGRDPAHPHFLSVRGEMADLLEMDSRRPRSEDEPGMSLQEAYERACWQNPEVRNILIAGQQSAGAQAQHQAAQRARSAAVGVRNAPRAGAPSNGATPPEQRSRADDIAAAFAHHAGEA